MKQPMVAAVYAAVVATAELRAADSASTGDDQFLRCCRSGFSRHGEGPAEARPARRGGDALWVGGPRAGPGGARRGAPPTPAPPGGPPPRPPPRGGGAPRAAPRRGP